MRLLIEPLEGQTSAAVIHNYGHGGSGVCCSWGCASDVAGLAKKFAADQGLHLIKVPLVQLLSGPCSKL